MALTLRASEKRNTSRTSHRPIDDGVGRERDETAPGLLRFVIWGLIEGFVEQIENFCGRFDLNKRIKFKGIESHLNVVPHVVIILSLLKNQIEAQINCLRPLANHWTR